MVSQTEARRRLGPGPLAGTGRYLLLDATNLQHDST